MAGKVYRSHPHGTESPHLRSTHAVGSGACGPTGASRQGVTAPLLRGGGSRGSGPGKQADLRPGRGSIPDTLLIVTELWAPPHRVPFSRPWRQHSLLGGSWGASTEQAPARAWHQSALRAAATVHTRFPSSRFCTVGPQRCSGDPAVPRRQAVMEAQQGDCPSPGTSVVSGLDRGRPQLGP